MIDNSYTLIQLIVPGRPVTSLSITLLLNSGITSLASSTVSTSKLRITVFNTGAGWDESVALIENAAPLLQELVVASPDDGTPSHVCVIFISNPAHTSWFSSVD